MGGKASLILVLGFSTIMLIVALNMNRVSTGAIDNSANHYENGMAKEIARSGINLAASNLSRDHSWEPASSYSYVGKDDLKITVKDSGKIRTVTSIGTHQDKSKLIEVKIELTSFSEYAYFSHEEGNIWWTGGDSIWGPFHTNDKIQVQGHPFFAGPRTSHAGAITYYTSKAADAPVIVGTYNPGVTVEMPPTAVPDLATFAGKGGYSFSGYNDVYLKFAGDSLKYKYKESDPYTAVLAKDFAPNGTIYVDNGNLHIEGTVKDKWSVGSNKDVYLENDVVYSDVPDPSDQNDPSKDLLGIIAEHSVIIADNTPNRSDINIHASIYCANGDFTAENYNTRPPSGYINLLGGIINMKRGPVGTFKIGNKTAIKTLVSGFNKNYRYDSRLLQQVPPYFPSTDTFKIVSWLE